MATMPLPSTESRVVILPAILRHLRFHIKNRDDLLDKSLEALGTILTLLHDQEPVSVRAVCTSALWLSDDACGYCWVRGMTPSLTASPPGPSPQKAVDEEIQVIVWDMLQVLLDCFTQLTGRSEKVSSVVVSPVPVLPLAPSLCPFWHSQPLSPWLPHYL